MSLRPLALLALLFALPLSGATITGTVRQAESGTVLSAMTVAVYDSAGVLRANATTNASGHYSVTVAAGSYRVLAYDNAGTFATSFFDGAESFDTSTVVTLQATQTVIANFALPRAGFIGGVVTSRSGTPLASVTVAAYNASGTLRGQTRTDAAGRYQLAVPAGAYRLAAWDDALQYATTFHADAATFAGAAVLTISAGNTVTANFALPLSGRIRGVVTDELTGGALPDVIVTAYDASGFVIATSTTSAQGAYELALRAGSYRLVFEERSGTFASSFSGRAEAFAGAAAISVTEGGVVSGVDASLPRAAQLMGIVRDAGGAPLANIIVAAYNPSGSTRAFTTTASDGRYRLVVPSGDYRLAAYDPALLYATQFSGGANAFDDAVALRAVAPQVIANLDFTLIRGGQLTGRVTSGGAPAAGVTVVAYAGSGALVTSAITAADGTYRFVVAPGTYTLGVFDAALRFATSIAATPLTVAGGSMQTRDFTVIAAAKVVVTARDVTTHNAISGIVITAYDVAGNAVASSATTGATGTAGLALPSGTYRFVGSDARRRYATAYYSSAASFENALAVTVVAGQSETSLTMNLNAAPSITTRRRAVGR